MTLANAQVQSDIDYYTKRFVSECSANELMNMQTEIRRIEREVEEYSKSEKSLEPADTGIEVGCMEDLQRLCLTKANITRLTVDPAKCT